MIIVIAENYSLSYNIDFISGNMYLINNAMKYIQKSMQLAR